MVNHGRKPVRLQKARYLCLVLQQAGRTLLTGKGQREIQMKARVDAVLSRKLGRAFRVLHEHHGADRRNRPLKNAIERSIRRENVPAPIIRIHDDRGRRWLNGVILTRTVESRYRTELAAIHHRTPFGSGFTF